MVISRCSSLYLSIFTKVLSQVHTNVEQKDHDECVLRKLWAVSIQTDPELVIETLGKKLAQTIQEFECK